MSEELHPRLMPHLALGGPISGRILHLQSQGGFINVPKVQNPWADIPVIDNWRYRIHSEMRLLLVDSVEIGKALDLDMFWRRSRSES